MPVQEVPLRSSSNLLRGGFYSILERPVHRLRLLVLLLMVLLLLRSVHNAWLGLQLLLLLLQRSVHNAWLGLLL